MATYREAGVDLEAAERLIGKIEPAVRGTWSADVVGSFGGFAAGITVPSGFRDPVLMLSTDGVGTKGEVARVSGRVDGLGQDLVAMCADDLSAAGARPIAFADYIAVGALDVGFVERLVTSVAAACRVAGMALLAGETAEHPGVMDADQFDVSGTALGVVERGHEIDGSEIEAGDRILGIASPNVRCNGFSLLRATILRDAGSDVVEEVIEPSVIYTPAVQTVLAELRPHALAHITGGGIPGNLARVLPPGASAHIDPSRWARAEIFDRLGPAAGIDNAEMYRTFNMGIGFVLVTSPGDAAGTIDLVESAGHRAWDIGRIVAGDGRVQIDF